MDIVKTTEIIKNFREYIKPFVIDVCETEDEGSFLYSMNRRVFAENMKEIDKKLVLIEQFKCLFCGRQSSGRSDVINAILGEEVLPSSAVDTTFCFLSVEGCNTKTGHFIADNGEEKELKFLNEFLRQKQKSKILEDGGVEKEYDGNVVKVFYPMTKCALLKSNIQLINVPSAAIESDLLRQYPRADVWIHVFDSDVAINNEEFELYKKLQCRMENATNIFLINSWSGSVSIPSPTKRKEWRKKLGASLNTFAEVILKKHKGVHEKIHFVTAKSYLKNEDTSVSKEIKKEFNEFIQQLADLMKSDSLRCGLPQIRSYITKTIDLSADIINNEEIEKVRSLKDDASEMIESKFAERKQYYEVLIKAKCDEFILTKEDERRSKFGECVVDVIYGDLILKMELMEEEVSSKLSGIYGGQRLHATLPEDSLDPASYLGIFDVNEGDGMLVKMMCGIIKYNVNLCLNKNKDSFKKTAIEVKKNFEKNEEAKNLMTSLKKLRKECDPLLHEVDRVLEELGNDTRT